MDHDMPMPGHGGEHKHGEMECSMSMLWNTSTRGLCVVFPSWKVTGHQSLLGTLVALFLLSMLLEYLRLCVRSLDARLIASNQLSSGILGALTGNPSHRRKASVQHRHVSQGVSGGGAALLSSGVNATLGERRQTPTDSTSSSWGASDDDAPLLPAASGSRRTRRTSLWTRMQRAVVPPLPIARSQQLRRTALYLSSLALSMFLMLVFMTYNAWLIASMLSGAACGHYLFSRDMGLGRLDEEKGMACHW